MSGVICRDAADKHIYFLLIIVSHDWFKIALLFPCFSAVHYRLTSNPTPLKLIITSHLSFHFFRYLNSSDNKASLVSLIRSPAMRRPLFRCLEARGPINRRPPLLVRFKWTIVIVIVITVFCSWVDDGNKGHSFPFDCLTVFLFFFPFQLISESNCSVEAQGVAGYCCYRCFVCQSAAKCGHLY